MIIFSYRYFLIERGKNMCGLAACASFPVVWLFSLTVISRIPLKFLKGKINFMCVQSLFVYYFLHKKFCTKMESYITILLILYYLSIIKQMKKIKRKREFE